jgi:uncharacterized membrane-anchored protein YitT (DUF2179 family)
MPYDRIFYELHLVFVLTPINLFYFSFPNFINLALMILNYEMMGRQRRILFRLFSYIYNLIFMSLMDNLANGLNRHQVIK